MTSLRTEFARQIATRCGLDRAFAELFPIRDALGRRVVVPTLETDPVHLALGLVQQAGGEGTLAVRRERTHDAPPSVVFLRFSFSAASGTQDDGVPVGSDCTIADLLKVLMPGSSITISADQEGGDELRIADLGDSDLPSDCVLG